MVRSFGACIHTSKPLKHLVGLDGRVRPGRIGLDAKQKGSFLQKESQYIRIDEDYHTSLIKGM